MKSLNIKAETLIKIAVLLAFAYLGTLVIIDTFVNGSNML